MSEPSLQELERDVEAARARLAGDLATLRSPSTFSEFTADLKAEALGTKDALVDKAKSSVQSSIQGVIDDLKGKALANPAAVLAIGAGLAWRLIKRPPVASVLVGAGLYSLLRTPPDAPESPYVTRASEMAGTLREQATHYGERAGELAATARERLHDVSATAQDTAADLRERAASAAQTLSESGRSAGAMAGARIDEARDAASAVADRANRALHDARDAAGGMAHEAGRVTSDLAARAGATLNDASSSVQRSLRDDDTRNTLLLGAAGLAVAAALGIAMQRRAAEPADQD
jgi:hypothetical protein